MDKAFHAVIVHEEDQSTPVVITSEGEFIVGLVEDAGLKWTVFSADNGLELIDEGKKGNGPVLREFRFRVTASGVLNFIYGSLQHRDRSATFNVQLA